MLVSELIARLQHLQEKFGDRPVDVAVWADLAPATGAGLFLGKIVIHDQHRI